MMSKKSGKASMDNKAANEGDRLKHPLLLEVLGRCQAWPGLTYAETHAGAGRYLESGQLEIPHICQLYEKVEQEGRSAKDSEAGGRYLRLLREWWADPSNLGAYPGSVLQAAIFFMNRRDEFPWKIAVTEAHENAWKRLSTSILDPRSEIRHDGFQNQIDWLTQDDDLVLLMDPFSFKKLADQDEAKRKRTKDRALNEGGIDIDTMSSIFAKCWEKKACVVLFWCAFAHKPGAENKREVKEWLLSETASRGAKLRWFRRGIYNIAIIGIGQGTSVVSALPGDGDWEFSWMPGFISEEV